VGKLRIEVPGMSPMEVPLIAAGTAERLGTFARIMAAARHLILG
jgi:hypothetical protein